MVKKDDLNIGDVIYFVDYVRTGDFHPTVRFAVVADFFSDGIDVDFYRPYDERYVRVDWDKFKSAIPIEDYEWYSYTCEAFAATECLSLNLCYTIRYAYACYITITKCQLSNLSYTIRNRHTF